MSRDDAIHDGERSWWDGSVKTLCGLKLEQAEYAGFFAGVTCPACIAARQGGVSVSGSSSNVVHDEVSKSMWNGVRHHAVRPETADVHRRLALQRHLPSL